MKYLIFILGLGLFFNSCKTQEQILREAKVDTIETQLTDSQKLTADTTSRIQVLEERLALIDGKVEESDHKINLELNQRLKAMEEQLTVYENNLKGQEEMIMGLKSEINKQGEYIQTVLQTLKGLSKKTVQKKKSSSPYQEAMANYKKRKYKTAKKQLLNLLANKKLKGNQLARAYHNLGMIEYMDNKNEDALAYFSKLYANFPKSGYNKNGLLVLGKTFARLKQTAEAQQTFQELITRYPKSKQAKEAQALITKK